MSNELKLTRQLILDILENLKNNDSRCDDDTVACQYLAAVIGYIVANQRLSDADKEEFAEELAAFTRHIIHMDTKHAPAPDPSQAFGIWKPGSN